MSIYPPPPAGWDASAAAASLPPSADDGLRTWASQRGYDLNQAPNLAWFQGWAPFVYVAPPARVMREVRARVSDAQAFIALIDEEPPQPGQSRGGATVLVSFLTSPRLTHRAAVRSRLQKEAVEELRVPPNLRRTPRPAPNWRLREKDRFMRRTYGRSVKGALGDAIFEAHFEITTPSRHEGSLAVPGNLRQLLIQNAFRGIVEVRPGGLVVEAFGPPQFEPAALDATIAQLGGIYEALVTPSQGPPSSLPVSGNR